MIGKYSKISLSDLPFAILGIALIDVEVFSTLLLVQMLNIWLIFNDDE